MNSNLHLLSIGCNNENCTCNHSHDEVDEFKTILDYIPPKLTPKIENKPSNIITKEIFLDRAFKLNGNRFNYDNINYIDFKTHIEIFCNTCLKFFSQRPQDHLLGKHGCPYCFGYYKTTEDIIQQFRAIHGYKYDYSKVVYIDAHTKVTIICPEHGEFEQCPYLHLDGRGCKLCGYKKGLIKIITSLEEFIEEATKKHGNRFNYDKVIYINSKTKVEITCTTCGTTFFNTMYKHCHSKSGGCPMCNTRYMDKEKFIKLAAIVHNNLYDYSKVVYINAKTPVEIICPFHGSFFQEPYVHLNNSACKECSKNKIANRLKFTTEEFILQAKAIWEDVYDYSKVVYINNHTKVEIVCKIHGSFFIRPVDHIHKMQGCSHCSHRISKPEAEFVKLLNISTLIPQYKIHSTQYHVDGYDPTTNTIYEFLGDYYHGNPAVFDVAKYNTHCHKTHGQLYNETFERFKLLKSMGYNVKYIWENDFNKTKPVFILKEYN